MAAPTLPASAWFPGEIHAEVVIAVVAIGVAYFAAWRVRGVPTSWSLAARFLAGLGVLLLALNGPLHDLSDRYLFSAHMVQHLLLTLVLPPLVLSGTPPWMADALLRPLLRLAVLAPLVRRLTRPILSFSVFTVAVVLWHLPGPYELTLESHGWHIVEHLILIAASVLAWWPVLSPSILAPSLPYGAQILYLFVFGMPMTIVAAMVTGAEEVLYPFYAAAPRVAALAPIEDQRLGGLIMWVPAGLIPVIAFTAVFFRWVASEPDEPVETEERGPRPTR